MWSLEVRNPVIFSWPVIDLSYGGYGCVLTSFIQTSKRGSFVEVNFLGNFMGHLAQEELHTSLGYIFEMEGLTSILVKTNVGLHYNLSCKINRTNML